MNEEYPPAILEQIFYNRNVARLLDHLTIHKGFDYSVKEMGEILHVSEIEIRDMVIMLKDDFDFIDSKTRDGVRTYKIQDNERTYLLRKFQFEVATYNIDKEMKKRKR